MLRIKPGGRVRSKRMLRAWYMIVLGYKPVGFKLKPWAIIAANKLPAVFNALAKEGKYIDYLQGDRNVEF